MVSTPLLVLLLVLGCLVSIGKCVSPIQPTTAFDAIEMSHCPGSLQYVVTAASSAYMDELSNLVGSMQRFEPQLKVIVYDIGLTEQQKSQVVLWSNVHEFKTFNFGRFPKHVSRLKYYAWKPIIVAMEVQLHGCIFFIDAGAEIQRPLDTIKQQLTQRGYWVTLAMGHRNHGWIYPSMYSHFGIGNSNLYGDRLQLTAAFHGWSNTSEIAMSILSRCLECALIKECIAPSGHSPNNHRWEQAAMTIAFYQLSDIFTQQFHLPPLVVETKLQYFASNSIGVPPDTVLMTRRKNRPKPFVQYLQYKNNPPN